MTTVEPRLYQGVRDVLPEELLPRQDLLRTLTGVFERFGFAPLETPAMEYLDILVGKYGADGEKLIYRLAYEDGRTLALRYDLTVPLARMVAMHPELPLPFKRYQIQPVWRADRPQPAQGRFREFYQCDVDTVGTSSLIADAENLAVVHEGMLALGMKDFAIRVNNRKVLRGMVASAGLSQEHDGAVLRVVDKLDKIGIDGVTAELAETGVPAAAITKLVELMGITGTPAAVIAAARAALAGFDPASQGLTEIEEVLAYGAALGIDSSRLTVDLSLTRGLDYYTGPIYEVVATSLEKFGSLGGGGRYDDLMTLFGKASVPATGVSIGLTRVLSALLKLDLLKARSTPVVVLMVRFADTPMAEALRVASNLRAAGLSTEVYYEPDRLKKQFQHADRLGIPLAAIMGSTELARGEVTLRDLRSGEQSAVLLADLPAAVAARLAAPPAPPRALSR